MNRARRSSGNKAFVAGGVYNPNAAAKPGITPPIVREEPQQQAEIPQLAQKVEGSMPVPIIPVKEEQVPMTPEEDPAVTNNSDSMCFDLSEDNSNGGKIPFKKIFQKRKKSSERTRDKKLRQNRQLRKSMLPKNALMALNEVKGITISDFTINNNVDGGFTAIVTVNSIQYEGKGQSKMAAKNLACEKALRDYILAKMTPKKKKLRLPTDMDTSEVENGGEEASANGSTDAIENPEDELPMLNLASFAIYKLFAEWEREGFVVPEMHPSTANAASQPSETSSAAAAPAKEPKKPPMRTELPSDYATMHPATLLCIMRPGITYVDYGCSGEKPNVLQRLGVIVDNQEFTANGRSKKIARRNVAVNVCNCLFGTNFSYEEY